MKKKKHQFHCMECNTPLEIYKKGKSHRILFCPSCNKVVAMNPSIFGKIAKGIAKSVPILGTAVSVGEELFKKKAVEGTTPAKARHDDSAFKVYKLEKALS